MALEIIQILASGTFGHVAVVRDSTTGSLLAAKALRHEHLENPRVVVRMRDEAQLLSRLDHPHIVQYEGLREIAGRPVILLEWVRGAPLDALLAHMPGGLPPAEACQIVRLTAAALSAAWNTADPVSGQPMRVIHRDIKPSNIILAVDGTPKLLDFGIAKGDFHGRESETVSVVLGAEGYVSPERLDGADDQPAGDIYALGCVLFELLTGTRIRLSLHPKHHTERMDRLLMRLSPAGVNPPLLKEICGLVEDMVAYDPEDRPDHQQVATRLGRLMATARWTPDLYRFARYQVRPLIEDRTFDAPHLSSAYEDLRFLETSTGSTPEAALPRESDTHLRAYLANDDWHLRTTTLNRMLTADPSWTSAPFVEAIDRLVGVPFWRRWWRRRSDRTTIQLVMILEFLRARPGPEVMERASALIRHRDPQVSSLARELASMSS